MMDYTTEVGCFIAVGYQWAKNFKLKGITSSILGSVQFHRIHRVIDTHRIGNWASAFWLSLIIYLERRHFNQF